MKLKGKISIITGSTGQLGSAITKALAQAGCNCICHYHSNKKKAEQLIETVKKLSVEAMAVQADLTKTEQIDNLFEKAAQFGTPQILLNSAAVFSRTPLEQIDFEQARKIFDLNLTAAILTSKAFAKIIKTNFGNKDEIVGKIINISDVAGIRPWAEYVLYCSSKAGLIGATKALAKELSPEICVNAIAPGITARNGGFEPEEEKRQLFFIPMRRFADVKEVAAAVIFMLENDYITGQVLNVDGGRCI